MRRSCSGASPCCEKNCTNEAPQNRKQALYIRTLMDRVDIVGAPLVEPSVIKHEPPDKNAVEICMEDIQSDDDTYSEKSIKSEEQDVPESDCTAETSLFIEDEVQKNEFKEKHTVEGSQEDDEVTNCSNGFHNYSDCDSDTTWEKDKVPVKEDTVDSESTIESNENAILNCLNTRQKTPNNNQGNECYNIKPIEKSDKTLVVSLLSTEGNCSKYQLRNHQSTVLIDQQHRNMQDPEKTIKCIQEKQTSATKTKKATLKDRQDSLLCSPLSREQSNKKNLKRFQSNNLKSKNTHKQIKEIEVSVKSVMEDIILSVLEKRPSCSQSKANRAQDTQKTEKGESSDDNTKQKQKTNSEDFRTQLEVLASICGSKDDNRPKDGRNNIKIKEKEKDTLTIKNAKPIDIFSNRNNETSTSSDLLLRKKLENSSNTKQVNNNLIFNKNMCNQVDNNSNLDNISNKRTLPKDMQQQNEVKNKQLRTSAAILNDGVNHIINENKGIFKKLKSPDNFKGKTSNVNVLNNKTNKCVTLDNKGIERLQKGGIIKETTVNNSESLLYSQLEKDVGQNKVRVNKINKNPQQKQDLQEQQHLNKNKQQKESIVRPTEEIIILDSEDDTEQEPKAKKVQDNGTQIEKLIRNSESGENKLSNMSNSMFLVLQTPQNQSMLVRLIKDEFGGGKSSHTHNQEAKNKEASNNESELKQNESAKIVQLNKIKVLKEKNAFDSDSNSDDEDLLKKCNTGKETSRNLWNNNENIKYEDVFDTSSDEDIFNKAVCKSNEVKAKKIESKEGDVLLNSNSDWFDDNPDDLIGSDSKEKGCNGKQGENKKRQDLLEKEPNINKSKSEAKLTDTELKEKLKQRLLVKTFYISKYEYTIQAIDTYQCNHCQIVTTKSEIWKHIFAKHRIRELIPCPYCPYKSFYGKGIKSHIFRRHMTEKDVEFVRCAQCDFKTKGKDCLKKHIVSHHTEPENMMDQMHKCDQCQKMFKFLAGMNKHKREVHNRETAKKFKCSECSYECVRRHHLQRHKNIWHVKPEEVKLIQCPKCSFSTYYEKRLDAHIRKMHKHKRFQCEKCAYQTFNSITLKLHLINHKEVKDEKDLKFRCDKCDYKTYRLYNFKIHSLNHLKPKDIQYFYCYHCKFKAKRKDNLKTHVLRHFKQNQGLFKCFICDFTTSRKDMFIYHINKHSEDQQKPQEK